MSEDYPLVVLVVPVHNNKEDTAEFLESLKKVTYPNYKMIIIDDGSTDGTEDMIKEKYPYVILLKGDGNLWWSCATNMGIEKAIEIAADYVLLTNNDTTVDSEFISALVDTAEKNPRSIIIPKVYYYDDPRKILDVGWKLNWLKGGFKPIGIGEIDEGQYNIQRDVEAAVIGILINTTFFKDLSLMDYKNFPLYWADVDFTYHAYKKGCRIIYEPKSMMWHKVDSTIKKGVSSNLTTSLSTFIFLTTDIRSPLHFRIFVKFHLRHCPIYFLPYILISYISVVILKSMQRSFYLDRQKLPFPLNRIFKTK